MNHDVFISYSSKNTPIAELILNALQAETIKCWMAPQSLQGGDEYEEIIEQAIRSCRIFVLVFSEPAVNSRWVNSELAIAFSEYKHIIPFKIDQTVLAGKMRVKLIQSHWINAYPEVAEKISELVRSVKATLDGIEAGKAEAVNDESAKELSFVQRFEYEDARMLFKDKKYADAVELLLPLALKGNRDSQLLLCNIYYHLSMTSVDFDIIRRISPTIKDTIEVAAEAGSDWANFICHCYASTQNDNSLSLEFLKKAIQGDSIGLAFLRLGIVYGWGVGVDVNQSHAIKCYERAIELGCAEAYSYYAQEFRWGIDEQLASRQKAIELYQLGIDARDWRATKGLFDLYTTDDEGRGLNEAAAFLEKISEEDVEGIELLYGEYYMSKYYWQGNLEEDWNQAKYFFEIALNNGYYEACGNLASLYCGFDDEKCKEYAGMGYRHGDSLSYAIMVILAKEEKDYAKAWEIAEERYYRFGVGAGELGELFMEHGYLPSEDYLPTLVRILQTSAAVGNNDSCKCLISLFSDEKYGMANTEMEEKYRHMSAKIGEASTEADGVESLVNYAKYLLETETPHYNPRLAVKYLIKAIERNSTCLEASSLLLQQFKDKKIGYYQKQFDKTRLFILRRQAYDVEKMFDDFIDMPHTEESSLFVKDFLCKAISDKTAAFANHGYDQKRLLAGIQLLKGLFAKCWDLSSEQYDFTKQIVMSNIEKYPYLVGMFLKDYIELFSPDYNEELGRKDFMEGRSSDNSRVFYAMNYSFSSECNVAEQDRYLSLLLSPIISDSCYEEIITRQDASLVDEEELWSHPLEEINDYYKKVCDHYGVLPVEDFARCSFEEIVPFFPRIMALEYYQRLIRALYHFAQHTEFGKITELLTKEDEMLSYVEGLSNQELQLLLISYVELRIDVENLLLSGNNVLNAVYAENDSVLFDYIRDSIKRLDNAGVKHNLTIPNKEQLRAMLNSRNNESDESSFEELLDSFTNSEGSE